MRTCLSGALCLNATLTECCCATPITHVYIHMLQDQLQVVAAAEVEVLVVAVLAPASCATDATKRGTMPRRAPSLLAKVHGCCPV